MFLSSSKLCITQFVSRQMLFDKLWVEILESQKLQSRGLHCPIRSLQESLRLVELL